MQDSPDGPAARADGMKQCPRCAERIQSAAVVCRYCGFDYASLTAPQAAVTIARSTNGLAIASMVLGILWLYWVGSILALIFGYQARRQIRESGGRQGGGGMATAGIVLGWIGVAVLALVVIALVIGAASRGY